MKSLVLAQPLPKTLLKIIGLLCPQAGAEPLVERLPLSGPTERETRISIRREQAATRSHEQSGNHQFETLHRNPSLHC